ncbi:MAG: hypothetical protein R3E39_09480 [Anaerolineae bacterium]
MNTPPPPNAQLATDNWRLVTPYAAIAAADAVFLFAAAIKCTNGTKICAAFAALRNFL